MSHLSINQILLKANSFSKKGKIEEARNLYQEILNSYPNDLRAKDGILALNFSIIDNYNDISNSLYKQGKLDEALETLKKVILQNPNVAESYYNIAIIHTKKNNLKEAVNAYKKAISLKPDFTEAYFNIGRIFYDMGQYYKAIEVFNRVISLNPDHTSAYSHLAVSISKGSFIKSKPHLYSPILKLLQKQNFIQPETIAKATISLIKCDPIIKDILIMKDNYKLDNSKIKIVSNLSNQPLLIKLMSVTPIIDLDIEALLINIRSSILLNLSKIQDIHEILSFQSSLALQCFINEHLYKENLIETEAIKSLEHSIDLIFSEGGQPEPFMILCLASYRPLYLYKWSQSISLPKQFQNISKILIHDFFKEKKLSSEMPILHKIIEGVSSDVRQQYEENPYPKWMNMRINSRPLTITQVVKNANLSLTNDTINSITSPDILIAGCGTGVHSIGAASHYKNSNVIAIDLSLRSLAYAKRKTQEFGLNNIRYMQADILDLEKLDKQFDIIECAGVLHHMKDPMAGWQVLRNCLKPGGLMRIGLYSELAREYVVQTRNEIKKLDLGTKSFEIKSFRNNVTKLEKSHHHQLVKTADFYDLSSFRDLVFHIQEHRFTIPQINKYLSNLGMRFCGFLNDSEINRTFRLENKSPDDAYNLEKWKLFEEMNTDTFSNMYQFWCQKI